MMFASCEYWHAWVFGGHFIFSLFHNLPQPTYVCTCVCGCKQAGAGYVSTGQLSLEAEKTWLQYECDRWGLTFNLEGNPGI
jgi:hypothetical protein